MSKQLRFPTGISLNATFINGLPRSLSVFINETAMSVIIFNYIHIFNAIEMFTYIGSLLDLIIDDLLFLQRISRLSFSITDIENILFLIRAF